MMIAVSSGLPFSRVPVRAMAVTPAVTSVPPLVIHFFDPLTTQCLLELRRRPCPARVGAGVLLGEPNAQSFLPPRMTSPR
jgi:hypothetical protein